MLPVLAEGEAEVSTLLEISEDLLSLEAVVDEFTTEDGEIDPKVAEAIEQWFAELEEDRDRKLDNYGALVREKLLRAKSRKEEADRLQALVRADENQAKYLKQRMLEFFDRHKIKKLDTHRFRFSVRGNGGLEPLDKPEDPTTLPEQYQRKIIEADTDTIRKALAAGIQVPGCALKPRGRHLQIN